MGVSVSLQVVYPTSLSKLKLHTDIAQMAELVDALVSGTSIRKYVQVRVLFWAQSGKATWLSQKLKVKSQKFHLDTIDFKDFMTFD